MKDYLIELVFKDIPQKKLGLLLKELSSNGKKISNYHFTCSTIEIDWNDITSIEEPFVKHESFGLFINLKEIQINKTRLPNCGIAIYKTKNKVNLELNFQLSEVKNCTPEHLAKNLMLFAKQLSRDYNINEFYGGLEPAQDLRTRLFTNDHLGPFLLKS